MTTAGPGLHRLVVDDVALAALCTLATPGHDADQAAARHRAVLADRGIVDVDGELPGWMAELGAVVAGHGLHLVLELLAADRAEVHQVWATPRRSVVGSPAGNDTTELRSCETVVLPFELLRLVGMGPRPVPDDAVRIVVPATAMEAAESAIRSGDTERAVATLTAAGVDGDDTTVLVALHTERRLTWRITSVRPSLAGSLTATSLAVVDGGDAGIWQLEVRHDGTPGPSLRFDASRPSEIWRRLLDLLAPTPHPEAP